MSITSLLFLAFVAVTMGVYFIAPKRIRWVVLLAASTVFYVMYDVKLSIWLYISCASIYLGGLWIAKQEQKFKQTVEAREDIDRAERKLLKKKNAHIKSVYAVLIAVFNLAIWLTFKFTDMVILKWNQVFSTSFDIMNLALPLGISFYTLQAISYVVDVSRGKCEAQRNFFKLTLWLSFFPQMIQGPICRYSETAEQLYTPHNFDYRRVKFGAQLMLWGYFKKLVIADRVGQISIEVFGNSGKYSGIIYIIGALAYTIQIYGDFSGGMDIICGAAEMLGIYLPKNFERPYFSRSIAEYWRRWHITLGAWFREYVFYPLSISKAAQSLSKRTRKLFGPKLGKMIPTYIAMIIVWTLNGIWHGSGKQFAVYGFYQGFLIILGMQTEPYTTKLLQKFNVRTDCFSWKLWQTVRTFALVVWGRILFKAANLHEAFRIWGNVFKVHNPWVLTDGTLFTLGLDAHEMFILFLAVLVLLMVSILQEKGVRMRETIERQNLVFRWLVYLAAIFAVILLGAYGEGYNAADFIYANF